MKNFINKMIFSITLVFAFTIANAQVGFEGIIVETYYVANAADNAAIPTLPVGAKTYRVYADLAAGWEFQALYGEPAPQHFLKFNSTTPFINFSGGKFRAFLVDNTALNTGGLALDTWLTVGAANDAEEGVLKTEDDGSNNLLSTHPQLNNSGGAMGTSLKTQDGMILTPGIQDATVVGLTTPQQNASLFVAAGVSSFQDDDFAISTTGTVGTGPGNKVLIGQFTTAGDFGFELNIQIRNATTFVVEKWVANNHQVGEFTHPTLTRVPNTAPTVTLDQPAANANVVVGTVIPLAATANDAAPGSVTLVEFLLDGTTVISSDNSAPYTGSWTSIAGCHTITARATDNEGAQTTSTPAITICAGANQPPTITVSAPSNAIVGDNVNITSVVGDVDGSVTQVEFFVDNVSIGVDNTPPSFSFNWTAVLGIHSIKGVATDNIGATTTSNVVSINVAANTPPTASITAPANGASYTHPAVVTIDAIATDVDGTITNVEFLVNNVVVGSDNSFVGSSRVDLQACKLEYSIVSPK